MKYKCVAPCDAAASSALQCLKACVLCAPCAREQDQHDAPTADHFDPESWQRGRQAAKAFAEAAVQQAASIDGTSAGDAGEGGGGIQVVLLDDNMQYR
jgi:hypothetical protein